MFCQFPIKQWNGERFKNAVWVGMDDFFLKAISSLVGVIFENEAPVREEGAFKKSVVVDVGTVGGLASFLKPSCPSLNILPFICHCTGSLSLIQTCKFQTIPKEFGQTLLSKA